MPGAQRDLQTSHTHAVPSHRYGFLAVTLQIPARRVPHVRKQCMHAGRCNLGLQGVELVFDLAVLLRDRVKPLHFDRSERISRFRMRYFPAHLHIIAGVDQRKQNNHGEDSTFYD